MGMLPGGADGPVQPSRQVAPAEGGARGCSSAPAAAQTAPAAPQVHRLYSQAGESDPIMRVENLVLDPDRKRFPISGSERGEKHLQAILWIRIRSDPYIVGSPRSISVHYMWIQQL